MLSERVDLDNLEPPSVHLYERAREIISGPGYAESVMSIFFFREKKKKQKYR